MRLVILWVTLLASSSALALTWVSAPSDPSEPDDRTDQFVRLYSLSNNGRYITFRSNYSDLTEDDANATPDTFVFDTQNGTMDRIEVFNSPIDTPGFLRAVPNGRHFLTADNGRYVIGIRDVVDGNRYLRFDRVAREIVDLSADIERPEPNSGVRIGFLPIQPDSSFRKFRLSPFWNIGRTSFSRPTALVAIGGSTLSPAPLPGFEGDGTTSRDGRYLLVSNPNGSVSRIDQQTGSQALSPEQSGGFRYLAGDGSRVLRQVSESDGNQTISRLFWFNFETQQYQVLVAPTSDPIRVISVSPYTGQVLYERGGQFSARDRQYALVGVSGTRDINELVGLNDAFDVEISRDGELLAAWTDRLLLAINLIDGERSTIELSEFAGRVMRVIPGNRGIAFTTSNAIAAAAPANNQPNLYFLPRPKSNDASGLVTVLESPQSGEVYSGVQNIRGWALSNGSGVRSVDFSIDGVFYGALPLGGPRDDVGDAFPDIENARDSGFSAAFNFNELPPGLHRIEVTITDDDGSILRRRTEFLTRPILPSFVSDPNQIDTTHAVAQVGTDGSIQISGVQAAGVEKTVTLQWQVESQTFAIIDVENEP